MPKSISPLRSLTAQALPGDLSRACLAVVLSVLPSLRINQMFFLLKSWTLHHYSRAHIGLSPAFNLRETRSIAISHVLSEQRPTDQRMD